MSVKIEIPIETVDSIVLEELKFTYEYLKEALERYEQGNLPCVFYIDTKKDKKKIKKTIKALRLVMQWYTVGGKEYG